jgi:hypothetical protein
MPSATNKCLRNKPSRTLLVILFSRYQPLYGSSVGERMSHAHALTFLALVLALACVVRACETLLDHDWILWEKLA